MGKITMNMFDAQLTLLVAQCLLEVDIRNVRKSHESLNKKKKKKKTWKPQELEQCAWETQKKMETMHLKNEFIKMKNDTLKVWNGTKIIIILKNSMWLWFLVGFRTRTWVQFWFFVMIKLRLRGLIPT